MRPLLASTTGHRLPCNSIRSGFEKSGSAGFLGVPHSSHIDRVEMDEKGTSRIVGERHLSVPELKAVFKALIKKFGL